MEQSVFDWIIAIFTFMGALSVLVFAIGYVWSVVNKYHLIKLHGKSVERNNEMWLTYLFDDASYEMLDAIRAHPDDFMEWFVSVSEKELGENIVLFDTYINLLNTCSLLETRGVIPTDLFWNKMNVHLKSIVACKSLYSFFIEEEKYKELKVKLLEMPQCAG